MNEPRPTDSRTAYRFTLEQIEDASADYGGFCLACGAEADNVEPDARRYTCDACGADRVFGAEEIALMGLID